jgi:histidine triad (HIT) family protein
VRRQASGLEHGERRHTRATAAVGHRAADAARPTVATLTEPGCAFCAIIRGEVPAEIVYADDLCVAILDHHPLFYGHTLLVPRSHVVTYAELPPSSVGPFMLVGQRLERAVEAAMASDGSLMLMNNVVSQSVPHLHLHVIPRKLKDGLRFWLGPRRRYDDEVTISATGQRIRDALAAADPGSDASS